MVDRFDHRKQIGRVVDPVKPVDAHLVEVLHKNVDIAFARQLQKRLVKQGIGFKGLLFGQAFGIARMHNEIRNAENAACLDTARCIGNKCRIVGGQRCPHRCMRLNEGRSEVIRFLLDA